MKCAKIKRLRILIIFIVTVVLLRLNLERATNAQLQSIRQKHEILSSAVAASDEGSSYSYTHQIDDDDDDDVVQQRIATTPRSSKNEVEQCTSEQLDMIKIQLPPDDCEKFANKPHTQRCSFSYATRCPDSVWIDEHYAKLHKNTKQQQQPSFAAVFVGCNKGMDAINALRMGSGNSQFDVGQWREAMGVTEDDGVCHQARASLQFALPHTKEEDDAKSISSQVYCIEPMPATFRALSQSSTKLGYNKKGLTVTHAAVSKTDGTIPFPNGHKAGKEGKSIEHCMTNPSTNCVDVKMYSLDTYMSKFVEEDLEINYLSVDVEGFDQDVLLGGKDTLKRVHYLEFEYNWMGSWRNQTLSHLINMLDDEYGFTCYWPGIKNSIWRITGCWLDYYDIQFWSNVACVNRNMEDAKGIADRMEELFHETLKRGDEFVMSFANRKKLRLWRQGKEYVERSDQEVSVGRRKRQEEKKRQKQQEMKNEIQSARH